MGELQFRVWAPKAKSIALIIQETSYSMQKKEGGIYECFVTLPDGEIDYFYEINGKRRPDPASRWQPYGVHGPSRMDSSNRFVWKDQDWKAIPIQDYIIYELHVGTFTPKGTFEAILDKIPYLKSLGVTAIELMPVIEFPGDRNWGYDGVYPYAPHHSYGGPEGLKILINALHNNGFAVILDVVYNHWGPEGNYLGEFGDYFTDRYKTPWGMAINYDGANSDYVRDFVFNNALYWVKEFHVDALRLDAVHAIFDFSAYHLLEEMRSKLPAYLIAESDLNDVRIINSKEKGGYALHAQWNEDFHHSVHAYFTAHLWGYFIDFGSLADIAKALTVGFVYDGKYSQYRGKRFGNSSLDCSGSQLIGFIQNHDQIGNACQGKRLGAFIHPDQYRVATTLLFCAPYQPLLFMGQEWNATTPFYYFTSFEDEKLAHDVKEGFKRDHHLKEDVDPQSLERFTASKLQWSEIDPSMLKFYQDLIALRKRLKCLSNGRKDLTKVEFSEKDQWLMLKRSDPSGSQLLALFNFSKQRQKILLPEGNWELIFSSQDEEKIPIAGWTALIYIHK